METMKESWTQVLDIIQSKINFISFKSWFSNLELVEKTETSLILKIDSPFKRDYINKNEAYIDLLDEAIITVYGFPLQFEIYTEEEINNNAVKPKKVEKSEIINVEERENRVGTNLNPKLTFDNYVVGNSNQQAQLMALTVAEQPGKLYNPLFIYGKSGLGKTHLMMAIGNYIVDNTDKKVLYVPCEEFTDDFQQIFRKQADDNSEIMSKFREKYRNIDVLIIDDIQRLAKKEKTQDEFFNTFENLHKLNKQIIIASDTSPNDLQAFEDRLKTRFVWGLTVTIEPPDIDLKKKILKNKIAGHEAADRIDENVLDYIANNSENDVRHLEGLINRLYFLISMYNPPKVDLSFAQEYLKDSFGNAYYTTNNIGKIQKAVADYYGITVETLKSKKRKAEINHPRQVGIYLCHLKTEESLERIGLEFNKNHSTVTHACKKITAQLKTDEELKKEIKEITDKL